MIARETSYKKIGFGLIATSILMLFVLGLQLNSSLGVSRIVGLVGIASFVVCLVFTLGHAFILLKSLPGKPSKIASLAGLFLIVGGVIFDVTVTVTLSPDLSREGNFIVKMLLDMHVPLPFIYGLGFILQSLMAVLASILWICFLKSYPAMVRLIPYKNIFTTYKWFLGYGKMSFKDWLSGRNFDFHFSMSSFFFTVVMSFFYSWYVAMEWLELVPISRIIVPIIILFSPLWVLVLFTHYHLGRLTCESKKRNCLGN